MSMVFMDLLSSEFVEYVILSYGCAAIILAYFIYYTISNYMRVKDK